MARDYRTGTPCPKCNVDFWVKDSDYDYETQQATRVWKCPNCNFRRPRQTRRAGTEITSSQQAAIERIRAYHLNHGERSSEYEVKEEVQEMNRGMLIYRLVVGRKNDAGTMAEVFGRTRVLMFIGRQGGLRTIDKKGRRLEGRDAFHYSER